MQSCAKARTRPARPGAGDEEFSPHALRSFQGQNIRINTGNDNTTGSNETEHGHVTAQMTVYGASGGASVNASFDRSQNSARETAYNNSVLLADQIDLTTSGDATLRGATVRAESELNTDIQGDLILESVQNRASSQNSSAGMSGGFSLGGDNQANQGNAFTQFAQGTQDIGGLSGTNIGANRGDGMTSRRETVLTSLTSGGTANINVQNHTQITGGLIGTLDADGNDLNQMNFSTGTLGFTDLRDMNVSSQTSAGLSVNFNLQPVNPPAGQPAAQSASRPTVATGANGEELKPGTTNIVYNNSQQNSASNTLATLGHGTIAVGGTVLEHNGALTDAGKAEDSPLAGLNRDTTATTHELWNSDYSQKLDATLDNRLLDPSRWGEIGQDYVNAAEASKNMFNAAVGTVETYRRELAAMGDDLPENLRGQLGQTGEDLVDALIRNGYTDEQIDALLARERVISGLASQESVRGYSVDQLTAAYREGQIEASITPASVDASGNLSMPMLPGITVTGSALDANALQMAVTGLGQIQQEIDALMQIDPALAQGLQLGIQLVTGGPVKIAIGYALNSGIDALAGNKIQQATGALYQYTGSVVQQITYDEFGNELALEQEQGKADTVPGASTIDTVDGIRLAVTVLGVATDRLGNRASDSSHASENDLGSHQLEIGKVESYKDSKKVTGDGSIHRDHQPSKAALIRRAEEIKGEPLTPAEIRRIEDNAITVTVPADVHRVGPTYGVKNTRVLQESDARV